MQNEFVTFERLNNKEAALALGELFEKNGIDYLLTDESDSLATSAFGGNQSPEFRIKLRQRDFAKADAAVESAVLGDIENLPQDHYMLSFSDAELTEVIAHKDEWSPFDFMLARKLLREKGHELSDETVAKMREERLAELSKPEAPQKATVIAGYIFAFSGGLLGIFIGWFLSSHKKTLPNGQMIYAYSESDRKNGRFIFRIGIFFAILWTILYFLLKK